MHLLKRHLWTVVFGVCAFFIEKNFEFMPGDFNGLLSSVLTLAATLTAIFIGFISIILSLGSDRIFKSLNLDLSYIETLMIGTVLYLFVSFEAVIGFFITGRVKFFFMDIWFATMTMSFTITFSLLFDLFLLLHGQWKRRKDNEDLY